ncbi:MAG TPA: hypothetical protein VE569_09435 [Acidimicrobiia bacterium]|nr:hypothetical protein [Acidimicrobiia bacterium]
MREIRSKGLRPLAAGLSVGAVFTAVLAIPLQAAVTMDLSDAEFSSWIFVAYGFSNLLAIALTLRYRRPLLTTANVFILIFVVSLGGSSIGLNWSGRPCLPEQSCWFSASLASPIGSP